MKFWNNLYCLVVFLGASTAKTSFQTDKLTPPYRVKQCREGCLEKFSSKDLDCLQQPQCSVCWDQCTTNAKINTNLSTWPLRIVTMTRNESLVNAEVAWHPLMAPHECLVTWEISGGGLKGNMLTETSNVQLSLWLDTKYRVQVTCKNKLTEQMSRSLPLTLDTNHASIVMPEAVAYSTTTASIRTTRLPASIMQNTKQLSSKSKSNILSRKLAVPDFEGLRKYESLLASAKTTSSTPVAAIVATVPALTRPDTPVARRPSSKFETNNFIKNSYQPQQAHQRTGAHLDDYVWNMYDKKPLDIIVYSTTFLVLSIVLVVLLIVLIVKMRKSRSDNDKMVLIDHEVTSNLNTTTCEPQILHV